MKTLEVQSSERDKSSHRVINFISNNVNIYADSNTLLINYTRFCNHLILYLSTYNKENLIHASVKLIQRNHAYTYIFL